MGAWFFWQVTVQQDILKALFFERRVVVVQQILGLVAEGRGISHLLGHPRCGGMICDSEVLDLAATISYYTTIFLDASSFFVQCVLLAGKDFSCFSWRLLL